MVETIRLNNDSTRVTTGLDGLDAILGGLRLGDNVVWSIDRVRDYQHFVKPFVRGALNQRRRVVYIRFAQHPPLLEDRECVGRHQLEADRGFESFAARVHAIIREEGEGVFYVFDCLSDLLSVWATDNMVSDFFRVTCPYLYELNTVGYFGLIRDNHSYKSIARIRETTQVLLGLRQFEGKIYVQPIKVWERRSPTMFLPHAFEGDRFEPVTTSYEATHLMAGLSPQGADPARKHLDYWHLLFLQAEDLAGRGVSDEEQGRMVDQLCRVLIGREARILDLARTYFTLRDLLAIKSRLIGTGYIGGKAVGMLLARNILLRDNSFDWSRHLEPHDSFFLGSDVFYSFIVHNGLWKLLMRQKTRDGYFPAAAELREKIQRGSFPLEIREELRQMLEYFGQCPIILRSSSLLEDSFGNAFAGKYESVFCVNQGTPEERFDQMEEAIRTIFASAFSEEALVYRRQRGLDHQEEQIALLLQRVSGVYRKHFYFPDLAGVGISYNPFVWSTGMEPQAGMVRLVLGLGTRAVDRIEGDYARLIALDAPLKQPHAGFEDARRFSQRNLDLLNINENAFQTVSLLDLEAEQIDLPWARYGVPDYEAGRKMAERGWTGRKAWILTFDPLLTHGRFVELMRGMLKSIESVYQHPVEIEFTLNFTSNQIELINLLQCRPFQTKGQAARVPFPETIEKDDIVFQAEGYFMGGSLVQPLARVIWIDPERYVQLPLPDRYELARVVGRLNQEIDRKQTPAMLLGPGRWGTSTPSLGIPVRFSEINRMAVLVELAFPHGGFMPELSYGTHFFHDLVEEEIFYLALFPENPNCRFNRDWFDSLPNALEDFLPEAGKYQETIKVGEVTGENAVLWADLVSQKVLCARHQLL
jgi:hypothetical protein